jgi:hypothetical protein
MKNKATFKSDLSNIEFSHNERIPGHAIQNPILGLIKADHADFSSDQYLAISELNFYREKYISNYLLSEIGELSHLEQHVIGSLKEDKSLVSEVKDEIENRAFGEIVADKVATFGGSWTFIICFGFFILVWICINNYVYLNKGFDPYPFILLNLILSCLAALQAPVIMMSQNRQEEKDRNVPKKTI